jgi:hypothetical protein
MATTPNPIRAQQKAMPVIGFLSSRSPGEAAAVVAAFHQSLAETGYVEGQNLAIQYRWAEGRYDRLPALLRADRLYYQPGDDSHPLARSKLHWRRTPFHTSFSIWHGWQRCGVAPLARAPLIAAVGLIFEVGCV